MCIISAFPKGTEKNNEKTREFIKNGFDCNKDGSGFMFKRAGESLITVNKGFFNLGELLSAIEAANLKVEDELVVHHRISTAGRVSKENCHPFVLSKLHSEVSAININTNKPCLVHNGMFSNLRVYQDLDRDFSDTYAFARYILSNVELQKIMDSNDDLFNTLTDHIIGHSKLCILFPEKDKPMLLYGEFVEDDGYYHSNKGYCSWVYNKGGKESSKQHKQWSEGDAWDEYYRELEEKQNAKKLADDSKLDTRAKAFLNEGTSSKLLPMNLKLDGSILYLTSKNCTHFNFISKKNYTNHFPGGKLELGSMLSFDPLAQMQTLEYREDGKDGVFAEGILTNLILKDFWYIPKGDYTTTYFQYLHILKKVGTDVGKQTLKKLNVLLQKHINLTNDKVIRYDKLDSFYLKSALTAFRDHLENLLISEDKWKKNNLLVVYSREDAEKANLQSDVVNALPALEIVKDDDLTEEIKEDNCMQTIVDHLEINT